MHACVRMGSSAWNCPQRSIKTHLASNDMAGPKRLSGSPRDSEGSEKRKAGMFYVAFGIGKFNFAVGV